MSKNKLSFKNSAKIDGSKFKYVSAPQIKFGVTAEIPKAAMKLLEGNWVSSAIYV